MSGQSERTRVGHCKRDEIDVYVGRGYDGETIRDAPIGERGWLGNPFPTEEYGRELSIKLFKTVFLHTIENDPAFRRAVGELAGSRLGCWCQEIDESEPSCHGEVIAMIADKLAD